MAPPTRAPVGLQPTRSGRCPAHSTSLSTTSNSPTLPSRVVGWRVPRHRRGGFPCCNHPPLPCVPPPLPRRSRPMRASPSSRPMAAFPLFRRVGLRVARFEACSAFTRVAARMVAEPPKAARYTEVLQSKSLPPSIAPIATGWSDCCRAGFAPAEGRRLSTAH